MREKPIYISRCPECGREHLHQYVMNYTGTNIVNCEGTEEDHQYNWHDNIIQVMVDGNQTWNDLQEVITALADLTDKVDVEDVGTKLEAEMNQLASAVNQMQENLEELNVEVVKDGNSLADREDPDGES